jgi:hypothetical protein
MDAGTPTLLDHPVQLALILVALAALLFTIFSFAQAWSMSRGHPDFDRLGIKKWVMGSAVVGYMPPAAMTYVKRYFIGFAAFILSIVGLGLSIAFSPSAAP